MSPNGGEQVNLSPRPQLQRIEVEKIANRACHMPSRCVYGGSPQIDVNIRVCGPVSIEEHCIEISGMFDWPQLSCVHWR